MVNILKLLVVIIFWTLFVQSCKSTHTVSEKIHFVSDTLIKTKTEVIQLPTHYTFLDKNPCKNDSLVISNQLLEIGKLRLKINNIKGQLVIEVNTDSVIDIETKEVSKRSELTEVFIEKIVTNKVVPKWAWYLLGSVVIYIAYRVARIYFPIIRFLPY